MVQRVRAQGNTLGPSVGGLSWLIPFVQLTDANLSAPDPTPNRAILPFSALALRSSATASFSFTRANDFRADRYLLFALSLRRSWKSAFFVDRISIFRYWNRSASY